MSNIFQKSSRIRKGEVFRRVIEKRLRYSSGPVVLFLLPNGLNRSRVGISVGKWFGNAVRRNRVKRLFREVWRVNLEDFPVGLDCVMLISRDWAKQNPGKLPTFKEVQASFLHLTGQVGSKYGNPEMKSAKRKRDAF